MNLADVFTIFFVILGFVIAFVSYWLFSAGLFPGMVGRAAERFGTSPVKATLLGAVIAIPIAVVGGWLSKVSPNGPGKLLGLVIALIPLLLGLLGSAGLALRIGTGLKSVRDAEDPWRRVLRGSIVLGLTFIMPVVGWFGVLPLTLVSGFGAFLLSVFARGPRTVGAVVPRADLPERLQASPPAGEPIPAAASALHSGV